MRIGTWIGRVLVMLLAFTVWALVWPDLRSHCDALREMGRQLGPAECDALNREQGWAEQIYLAVVLTPVVFVFVGHGRWRWLWPIGWTWLLLMLFGTLMR